MKWVDIGRKSALQSWSVYPKPWDRQTKPWDTCPQAGDKLCVT